MQLMTVHIMTNSMTNSINFSRSLHGHEQVSDVCNDIFTAAGGASRFDFALCKLAT